MYIIYIYIEHPRIRDFTSNSTVALRPKTSAGFQWKSAKGNCRFPGAIRGKQLGWSWFGIKIGFNGIYTRYYTWISWDLHGFNGIYMDFMGFAWISWDLHGFNGIYTWISWDLYGFNGIYMDFSSSNLWHSYGKWMNMAHRNKWCTMIESIENGDFHSKSYSNSSEDTPQARASMARK